MHFSVINCSFIFEFTSLYSIRSNFFICVKIFVVKASHAVVNITSEYISSYARSKLGSEQKCVGHKYNRQN